MTYTIYGQPGCKYCTLAKELLTDLDLPFIYVDISEDLLERTKFKAKGHETVPQIYFEGTHLGGYTQLKELLNDS